MDPRLGPRGAAAPWTPPAPVGARVSVIVPARDEAAKLPCLLDSLAADPQPYEVVVVDDRSTDGTAAAARRRCDRGAGRAPGGWSGKAYACWAGAQRAQGDLLVFLDADVEPAPGAVGALAAAAASSGGLVSASRASDRATLRAAVGWPRARGPARRRHRRPPGASVLASADGLWARHGDFGRCLPPHRRAPGRAGRDRGRSRSGRRRRPGRRARGVAARRNPPHLPHVSRRACFARRGVDEESRQRRRFHTAAAAGRRGHVGDRFAGGGPGARRHGGVRRQHRPGRGGVRCSPPSSMSWPGASAGSGQRAWSSRCSSQCSLRCSPGRRRSRSVGGGCGGEAGSSRCGGPGEQRPDRAPRRPGVGGVERSRRLRGPPAAAASPRPRRPLHAAADVGAWWPGVRAGRHPAMEGPSAGFRRRVPGWGFEAIPAVARHAAPDASPPRPAEPRSCTGPFPS